MAAKASSEWRAVRAEGVLQGSERTAASSILPRALRDLRVYAWTIEKISDERSTIFHAFHHRVCAGNRPRKALKKVEHRSTQRTSARRAAKSPSHGLNEPDIRPNKPEQRRYKKHV
eukprot:3071594-Pleurochrysis_carterae.AAC.3